MPDLWEDQVRDEGGRFQKGASGNPGGRPKRGDPEHRAALEKALPNVLSRILTSIENDELTARDVVDFYIRALPFVLSRMQPVSADDDNEAVSRLRDLLADRLTGKA